MGSDESITPNAPVWLTRRWERDTRYYQVFLQQDLWGQWVITRTWGRQGSRLGRVVNQPCADYAEALNVLEQIGRRRVQHGYVLRPEISRQQRRRQNAAILGLPDR